MGNVTILPVTMKSLALAVFLGLVLVDLAFAQGCVMCPQVVPQCPPSCRDCEIVPQSCDRCSYARCNDNGVVPGDLETRVSRLERVVSRLEQIVENRPVAKVLLLYFDVRLSDSPTFGWVATKIDCNTR